MSKPILLTIASSASQNDAVASYSSSFFFFFKEKMILAYSFGGVSTWLLASVALGLWQHSVHGGNI
jgi:hypothetical protein